MLVAAIDPGATTGIVVYNLDTQRILSKIQVEDYRDLMHQPELNVNQIIMENFILQRRASVDLTPVKAMAIVEYRAGIQDIPIELQMKVAVGHFWTDKMMESRGYLTTPKTKWKHVNDAMRHLLYWGRFGKGKGLMTIGSG